MLERICVADVMQPCEVQAVHCMCSVVVIVQMHNDSQ